jgi:hypothetical protein
MLTHHRSFLRLLTIVLLGGTLAACTIVTDPSKASSDATSGSSGKGSAETGINQEEQIRLFAAANFDRLQKDIAAGQGEHLTAFAMLLGVPQEQRAEFFTLTQEKFLVLFPSRQVTPEEMVAALTRELSSHPQMHRLAAMP